MQALSLSIAVLAAIFCTIAGLYGLLKGRMPRRNAWLLLAAGAVILFNAWMWATMPKVNGHIPQAQDVARAAQPAVR